MSGKGRKTVRRVYAEFTRRERDTVQRIIEHGRSCRKIARELGRSTSMVSAEVTSHRFVTVPERCDERTDASAAPLHRARRYRTIDCKRRPHVFNDARAAQLCSDSVLVFARCGINADEPAAAARLDAIRDCLWHGLSPEQMSARNDGPVDLSP